MKPTSLFSTLLLVANTTVAVDAPARQIPNTPPFVELHEPAVGTQVTVGSVYSITWSASDPDSQASIFLYWDVDDDRLNNAPEY